ADEQGDAEGVSAKIPFAPSASSAPSAAKPWYHPCMRLQKWLFLLIGFGIGFGGLYTWTKQRAPDVVRATPLPVDPNVPTDLSGSARNSSAEAPPAVNMAQVRELTEKIQKNPKDFDSIVELGNLNFDQKNY